MRKFVLFGMLMLFVILFLAPMAFAHVDKNHDILDMGITVAHACEVAIVMAAVIPEAPPGLAGIVASATLIEDTYMTTTATTCKYLDTGPMIATSAIVTAKIFGTRSRPRHDIYSYIGGRTYTMRYASTGVQHLPGHTFRL